MNEIKEYVNKHLEELYELHRRICVIPAPSGNEELRVEFCLDWFRKNCGEAAYVDAAKNVIFPYEAEGSSDLTVLCAHTDVVFPDTTPLPFTDDGERLRSPGVGDDTASLAIMMMAARYFVEHKIKTKGGVLFVANSCEEGLGDLKGTKQLFRDYEGRITTFVSYDAKFPRMSNFCVGSHRYLVEVATEGGHSWGAFGKKNAIAALSEIVNAIYSIEIPKKEGRRATINVGTIEGGTSVNTIAQSAKMLCEYRSDDRELLAHLEGKFHEIFEAANTDEARVSVTRVGNRPCMGDVDPKKEEALMAACAKALYEVTGLTATYHSSSTDCNIPFSLGIPAIAAGVYQGGGTHTREEWVDKKSMVPGFEIGIRTILEVAAVKE